VNKLVDITRESRLHFKGQELYLDPELVPLLLVLQERLVFRTALVVAVCLVTASACEAESGLASYYGGRGHGGEMTCAHRTRPLGSIVTITGAGRSIRCRINDRGPFIRGRIIDVSVSAARALGMTRSGVIRVLVE
jgi:rare lipoprotein A